MTKKDERQSAPLPSREGNPAQGPGNVPSRGNVPARENAPLAIDTATNRQSPRQGTERVIGVVKLTFQGINSVGTAGSEYHVSVFLWPMIWASIAAYGTSPPMFPMEEDMLLQGMFPATGFQIIGPQRESIIEALETALQTAEFVDGPSRSYENLDIAAAYPQLRDLPKPSFNSGDFLKKCNEFLEFLKNNAGFNAEVISSTTPINDEIKVCLQCGRPNRRSSKFCLVCGKKFDELEADAGMLAKALAPDAKTMDDWTKKAKSFATAGDNEAAIDYYEKLMPYKGSDATFWNEMGAVLQKLGRADAASEAFAKASQLKPTTTVPRQAAQKSRFCSKCGKENLATARFCIACGNKFS
jgi:hypothetical protein